MRAPLILAAALAAIAFPARGHAEPLWDLQVRAGMGVAYASAGAAMHRSPLALGGDFAYAVNEEPRVLAFGGVTADTLASTTSVSAVGGVRIAPIGSAWRFAAGATRVMAPTAEWGAVASGGLCTAFGHRQALCGDAQVTTIFATDPMATSTQLQFQLVVALRFDGT